MAVDIAGTHQAKTHPRLSTLLKLGLWIALATAVCIILFRNKGDQFALLFSIDWLSTRAHFLVWAVLLVILATLFWKGKSVRQQMERGENQETGAVILKRFLSPDIVIIAILVLLAYPAPDSVDLLIFRILAVVLAGFVLVYGRRAAVLPGAVLALYATLAVFPMAIIRLTV